MAISEHKYNLFGVRANHDIKLTVFCNHFQQWCCQLSYTSENSKLGVTWNATLNITTSLKKWD